MKIAVLDNVRLLPGAQAAIRQLADTDVVFPESAPTSPAECIARAADAEVVLLSTVTTIDQQFLDACSAVKYIGLCGTSTANIDLDALQTRGVAFSNVTDYGDEPTAEYIFLQLEALARGVDTYQWQDVPRELMGKSIGIIGLGALGKAIANLALAYKMDARYYSTHRKPEWEERGLRYAELPDLLAASVMVVISTPTNVQILGAPEFALLKPNSILVQASQGTPFDRDAFVQWIAADGNHAIFDQGVGSDNFHIYQTLPRVSLTPTSLGDTYETRQRLGEKVTANLKAYIDQQAS
jgi:phosphoglycerate dehydrogenase-like enzyme